MKILKKILLIIAILIAIPLVMALFIKKEYAVEREITINKPDVEVFSYVRLLKNQDSYSPWVMRDPGMKKEFRGTDGTTGFVYAYDSKDNHVGKGEQEISNLTEGKEVISEIRFERPMKGVANIRMTTEPVSENATKVKWGMYGKNPYPFNFMNLFMGPMLGKDLDKGLGNLKVILEK